MKTIRKDNKRKERIIDIIAEELEKSNDFSIDKLIEESKIDVAKIAHKEDIKKLTIINLIMKTVEQKKDIINNNHNLMPLSNINYSEIKEKEKEDIIKNTVSSIISEIFPQIRRRIKPFLTRILNDERISKVLEREKEHLTEERLNSIILQKKYYELLTTPTKFDFVEEFFKKIELYSESIELSKTEIGIQLLVNENYKSIVDKVPYNELLRLIELPSKKYSKSLFKKNKKN